MRDFIPETALTDAQRDELETYGSVALDGDVYRRWQTSRDGVVWLRRNGRGKLPSTPRPEPAEGSVAASDEPPLGGVWTFRTSNWSEL